MTSLFKTKEEYQKYDAKWKELTTGKTLHDSIYYLLNNLLRGYAEDRGFTPITNPTKLLNGQTADQGLRMAKESLRWSIKWPKYSSIRSIYGDLLSEELLQEIGKKL
jgi:hypothetical protein